MAEWICRTYKWDLSKVLWEIPAVQLALLWRCYAQTLGGLRSGTLMEDELAHQLFGKRI